MAVLRVALLRLARCALRLLMPPNFIGMQDSFSAFIATLVEVAAVTKRIVIINRFLDGRVEGGRRVGSAARRARREI